MRVNWLDVVCAILLVIGALNWGAIGLLEYDFVEAAMAPIFQPAAAEVVSRAIYALVGLAGIYFIYTTYRMGRDVARNRGRSAS